MLLGDRGTSVCVCEQLAQGCYGATYISGKGRESNSGRLESQANAITITPRGRIARQLRLFHVGYDITTDNDGERLNISKARSLYVLVIV